MARPEKQLYTEIDYYALPEDVRAELIDGQIYYQAAPSRIHQEILSELHAAIHQYIKSKKGSCKVYPGPFAVKLWEERKTIVEPDIFLSGSRNFFSLPNYFRYLHCEIPISEK